MILGAVAGIIGAGSALYGALSSAKAAQKAGNTSALRTELGPVIATDPYGIEAKYDAAGNLQLGYGQFAPIGTSNAALANLASGISAGGQIPMDVQNAYQRFLVAGGLPDISGQLGGISSLAGIGGLQALAANQSLTNAYAPFQQGLQNQLYGGAAGLFGQAAQGFDAYRDQTLDLLRQQAAPFEQRALQALQTNQFNTGRLGTTGGGMQTEAFARGLGQADLARQLQAGQEARNAGAYSLAQGQGLLGAGQGLTSMQDQLLDNAYKRFSGATGLGADLFQSSLRNMLDVNQLGYSRAGQNLATAQQFGLYQPQFLGTWQTLAGQGIGNQAAMQNLALDPYRTALASAQAAANARIGAGSNIVQAQGNAAQLAAQAANQWATFGTGIAGAIGDWAASRPQIPTQSPEFNEGWRQAFGE